MNTVEVLQRMKENLIVRGWTQGSFENENGVCMLGSLTRDADLYNEASESCGTFPPVAILAEIVVPDTISPGGWVMAWNDTKGRTFNEVMDAFDAAILLAKERDGS